MKKEATIWSVLIGIREAPFYAAMQRQGLFLKQPPLPVGLQE